MGQPRPPQSIPESGGGGGSGKGDKGPSPERHPALNLGACVAAAVARTPGGCWCLWLPMGAHVGTGGHACTQMPVFACACPRVCLVCVCLCVGCSGHLGLLASPLLAPMVCSQGISAR